VETRWPGNFVVQLKNEPGAMATLAEAIAARGVDLARSVAEHRRQRPRDHDDGPTTRPRRTVLDEQGYSTSKASRSSRRSTTVRWDGQARRSLADAGVNIYGHLFLGRWGDRATFAFVVDKPDVARPILERKD
jgi:hypothetical protein